MAHRVHRRCSSSPCCGGGRPSAKGIDLARGRKIGDGVRSTVDELEVKASRQRIVTVDGRRRSACDKPGPSPGHSGGTAEIATGVGPHSHAARFAGSFLGELLYQTGDLAEATRLLD
jgi:hypothetical protein